MPAPVREYVERIRSVMGRVFSMYFQDERINDGLKKWIFQEFVICDNLPNASLCPQLIDIVLYERCL